MTSFADALLGWYRDHGRVLPWRLSGDPYCIWISEVMLQQTRVDQVIPYYQRWMARFPTVQDLAEAPMADVLLHWEGLGYYRRAHHLHATAQRILSDYGGIIPDSPPKLQSLPGIGLYTAAAIASMGYGFDTLAIDSNIRRIGARLFCVEDTSHDRLETLITPLIPAHRGGDFNQALMDLGAAICTPRNPRCDHCPVAANCQAWNRGVTDRYPPPTRPKQIPQEFRSAALLTTPEAVGLIQSDQIHLSGLWQFPQCNRGQDLATHIYATYQLSITVDSPLGTFRHAYTHYRVEVVLFACRFWGLPNPIGGLTWVPWSEVQRFPMGRLARRMIESVPRGT